MNRTQFIERYKSFLSQYNIDSKDAHVSHGGAMLMLRLREETDDIDVTVTQEVWDFFERAGFKTKVAGDGFELKEINEFVDIHRGDSKSDLIFINGVQLRSAERTLRDKLELNREKDQPDIIKLKQYLSTTSNA